MGEANWVYLDVSEWRKEGEVERGRYWGGWVSWAGWELWILQYKVSCSASWQYHITALSNWCILNFSLLKTLEIIHFLCLHSCSFQALPRACLCSHIDCYLLLPVSRSFVNTFKYFLASQHLSFIWHFVKMKRKIGNQSYLLHIHVILSLVLDVVSNEFWRFWWDLRRVFFDPVAEWWSRSSLWNFQQWYFRIVSWEYNKNINKLT